MRWVFLGFTAGLGWAVRDAAHHNLSYWQVSTTMSRLLSQGYALVQLVSAPRLGYPWSLPPLSLPRLSCCPLPQAAGGIALVWGLVRGCAAPCKSLPHTRALCERLCPTMGCSASLTTPRWGAL